MSKITIINLLLFLVILISYYFMLKLYSVTEGSKTYAKEGEYVLVLKRLYSAKEGDLVIYENERGKSIFAQVKKLVRKGNEQGYILQPPVGEQLEISNNKLKGIGIWVGNRWIYSGTIFLIMGLWYLVYRWMLKSMRKTIFKQTEFPEQLKDTFFESLDIDFLEKRTEDNSIRSSYYNIKTNAQKLTSDEISEIDSIALDLTIEELGGDPQAIGLDDLGLTYCKIFAEKILLAIKQK